MKLFYILSDEYQNDFKWLRFLPHVKNEQLGIRNIVCDSDMDVITASSIGEDMIRCFKEKGLHLIVFLECEHMKYEFYELKKE